MIKWIKLLSLGSIGAIVLVLFFAPVPQVPSQSISICPQAQILKTNNATFLELSVLDNGNVGVFITNISVNNTTVFNRPLPIVQNQNLTVYFPMNNINGDNATVTFYLMVENTSKLENITAPIVNTSYLSLANITDVVLYALANVSNSTLTYYIINFSPYPVYVQKIQFANMTLLNKTIEVPPLIETTLKYSISTKMLYANDVVITTLKNYAGYVQQFNTTIYGEENFAE